MYFKNDFDVIQLYKWPLLIQCLHNNIHITLKPNTYLIGKRVNEGWNGKGGWR